MFTELIKRIVFKEKYSSDKYVAYLKDKGVRIGKRVVFFAPTKTVVDLTRPWLIEIGNDVQITEGVTILTHGYDWSVLKGKYGKVLGSSGKVTIGNNVFVGTNSTILKGVSIGDNVIIGANSLVNKDLKSDSVYAGVPVKYIMSIEEYYDKRVSSQKEEAIELVKEYRKVYNKNPGFDELSEFIWLFSSNYNQSVFPKSWEKQLRNVGNFEESVNLLNKNNPEYSNFENFINSIEDD